jgi:hypothetical protein
VACWSANYRGREDLDTVWSNWSGRVSGGVERYSEPDTLQDLVNVVSRATQERRQLTVVGSGWSQVDLAYSADWMVDIRRLKRRLKNVFAQRSDGDPGRAATISDTLVHYEAGIELFYLNEELDVLGLAMPTLGGANGQTLAGAIATGVHGGDIAEPPLPDLVAALHLVTAAGRELWVEPASSPVTDNARLARALQCPDLDIIRDDQLFAAVLVGLGRFGVIYSCVLRIRPAFKVAEWTVKLSGDQVLRALRLGQADRNLFRYLWDLLPDPPAHLRAVDVKNPRGLEVVFDTQNAGECYVRRRWPTTRDQDLLMEYIPDELCEIGAKGVLDQSLHWMEAGRIALALEPIGGAILSARIAEQTAKLRLAYARNPRMTSGEMLALVMGAAWNSSLGFIIPQRTKQAIDKRYATSFAGRRGPYHLIATGHRETNQQVCYRGDSVEPVFDATKPEYIRFVESVLKAGGGFQQAGYVSLRWSANSRALLAMHSFASSTAVAIEITSLKHLPDNERWMSLLESLAFSLGGRLHWGQINNLTGPQVSMLYGSKLTTWRRMLTALTGADLTFSNAFTKQRGLEPLPGGDHGTLRGTPLRKLRTSRQAAVTGLLLADG